MEPFVGEPSLIVGVGASAGGLEALERFFRAVPPDTGMSFVVIQHLSPDFRSLMVELVARFTPMNVVRVTESVEPQPNTIYLLSPNTELTFLSGRLRLVERTADSLPAPINRFFSSLAQERGDRCAAVILSGTGSDGTRGITDVHEHGGLVLVQRPETAKFDGMPRSAEATGLAHGVLPPEEMSAVLERYAGNPTRSERTAVSVVLEHVPRERADVLWAKLREVAGIDFSTYKPATVRRRLERRMALGRFASLDDYIAALVRDPLELAALHSDLLICVTRFFRDPDVFAALGQAIGERLEGAPEATGLRIWVPACATGEEAYSIAFLALAEAERLARPLELKIFATDVHAGSLRTASEGVYSEDDVSAVPEKLRDAYFLREPDGRLRVIARVRKLIVFSAHNLLRDVPFQNMDLVSCRNAIIYFNAAGQGRALSAIHFALKLGGILLLGPSESVGALDQQFQPIYRSWNIFRKVSDVRPPDAFVPKAEPVVVPRPPIVEPRLLKAYDRLLERFAPASLLVDDRREILHVFGDAGQFLRPQSGRPTLDVLSLVLPDLKGALTLAFSRAQRENQPVALRDVLTMADGAHRALEIRAEPLPSRAGDETLVLLQIADLESAAGTERAHVPLSEGGVEARVAVLERELDETRGSLNQLVQEIESSNEELQAANEELQASNEALQSANEELHAVNEELYSVNSEHEQKIEELAATGADLRNLMNASQQGIMFVDGQRRIRMFTPGSRAVVNLLPHDIGRPLTDITLRVRDDTLFSDLDAVVASGAPAEAEVPFEDGWILRRILPYQDADKKDAGFILTFLDITERKRIALAESKAFEALRVVVDALAADIVVTDALGKIRLVNRAWEERSKQSGLDRAKVGDDYTALIAREAGTEGDRARESLASVLSGAVETANLEYEISTPSGRRWLWMNIRRLPDGQGAVVSHTDVTPRATGASGPRT